MEQAKQTSLEVEVLEEDWFHGKRSGLKLSKQEVQQQQQLIQLSRSRGMEGSLIAVMVEEPTYIGGNALQTFQEARWTFSQCSGPRSSSV